MRIIQIGDTLIDSTTGTELGCIEEIRSGAGTTGVVVRRPVGNGTRATVTALYMLGERYQAVDARTLHTYPPR